ncbi:MAG: glycosyltransferase family 39 protein [Candidatus Zixiibacteriota bacterium]|nr:MAG: glycosyltransferase family 39 protein [candidate division Zixibacteria bacterium]
MREFVRNNRWGLIVALAAVAVRVVYLIDWSRVPDFVIPMVDEKWHWLWSEEIINDSFWGEGAYFRGPLYPYFLALLSWITGGSIFLSKLLQVFVCGGTGWFIYQLTEKLFNQRAAIIAGLIYTVYGILVFYEALFLIPVLFLFFVVWGMYRVVAFRDSGSWKSWLFTGIIFGLAAVARPNVLIVIPFLMLWLFLISDRTTAWTKRIRTPLLLLVGVILMILPVTARNIVVAGEPILISSQGGINLYLGNNTEADGLTMLMPEVDLDESVGWEQFEGIVRRIAEEEAGRSLTESELSSFWTGKAVDFMVEHPGRFMSLLWKKTVYLLSAFENSDNIDIYRHREKSLVYRLLVWDNPIYFPFGLLLPLALMGVYLTRSDFRKLLPIYIFVVAYIPTIILFLVTSRHRLPLVPFMIIIAAGGLVTLGQSIRKFRVSQMITVVLLFLVPVILLNRTFYEATPASEFQFYFNEGIKFERLGDYQKAEEAYLMADRDFPYSVTLLNNLGNAQRVLRKFDAARKTLERAIAIDTAYAASYNNLGLVMRQMNQIDSAIELYRSAVFKHKAGSDSTNRSRLSQYYLNAAEAYEWTGIADTADLLYRAALSTDTAYPRAYFIAAAYYARLGQYDKADSLFQKGTVIGEPSPTDLFNWGLSYLKRQRFREAIDYMHRVVARDESFSQAYHCLAVIYHENNMPVDSVSKYLELALKYNPNYGPSWELKRIISGQ